MNTQYSSLEEVWGTSFPKKAHSMTSKVQHPEQKRDAEKEGRVFPTPQHRSASAMQVHKKTIDDLSTSLPIAQHDEESNWTPEKVVKREHFTSTKSAFSQPFYPSNDGSEFPYAPPAFQIDAQHQKMNRLLEMMEKHNVGQETPATQDMLLYIVTGIFFLFTFDTFVNLGRRLSSR
jgi:hypothetical protein